jgi:hypothetical protein
VNRHILRVAFSIAAVSAATVPFLFTPACLSSPSTTSDSGTPTGSSGSSSSGSGSSSGSSSGTIVMGCMPPDSGAVDQSCVIDDMMNPATETGGYWYTYSDRTLPNSTILVPDPAGIISPLEGAQFPPDITDTTGPTVPGVSGPAPFREFTGSGLTLWGAGTGFDWKDITPPVSDDGGDAAAALGVPAAFDATGHTGISFYAKSNTGAVQQISLHFSDSREAAAAGMCNADAAYTVFDGGADTITSPTECSDDFFKNVNLTTDWANYTVKFTSVATQNYSTMGLKTLDITKLYQVHFQINNPGYAGKPIAPMKAWDYSIAYITFYDGP